MKRLTTEEFIGKAKEIHGNKYDYSKVEYVNIRTKVEIICKKHGVFFQISKVHLEGHGCDKCGDLAKSEKLLLKNSKKSSEYFVRQAIEVHGVEKYDYSKINYCGDQVKVEIICKKHGAFFQTPNNHLRGKGCPKCKSEKLSLLFRRTLAGFVEKAKLIHTNCCYDYSEVKYVNDRTKVAIICVKHGLFEQLSCDHLHGAGCPKCFNLVSKPEAEWLDSLQVPIRQYRIVLNDKKIYVDGFEPVTNTVYEFLGDYWHGNPKRFNLNDIHPEIKKTYGELYQETIERERLLKEAGYNVITMWESEYKRIKNEQTS